MYVFSCLKNIQKKTACLVHNFVKFEEGFHSESLISFTTLLFDPLILHYSQKLDPYAVLGRCVSFRV